MADKLSFLFTTEVIKCGAPGLICTESTVLLVVIATADTVNGNISNSGAMAYVLHMTC